MAAFGCEACRKNISWRLQINGNAVLVHPVHIVKKTRRAAAAGNNGVLKLQGAVQRLAFDLPKGCFALGFKNSMDAALLQLLDQIVQIKEKHAGCFCQPLAHVAFAASHKADQKNAHLRRVKFQRQQSNGKFGFLFQWNTLLLQLNFCNMIKNIGWVGLILFGFSCQNNTNSGEKVLEEIPTGSKVSDIIRNPASANELLDTANLAKITFDETEYNFGEVNEGDIVTHSFSFTNTGKVPLIISGARSTCGCTVPEYPQKPVAPGEKGEIKAYFNTLNKEEKQMKRITVTANTYPSETSIRLVGYVHPGRHDLEEAQKEQQRKQNQ